MIDMLDIFDAPESKPIPNAMREMIEPKQRSGGEAFCPTAAKISK
jgi:hypothetical protein